MIGKSLDNEACFMFLIRGSFEIHTPLNTMTVRDSDGFLSNCGEYVYEDRHLNAERAREVEAVAVYFIPEIIKNLFEYKPQKYDRSLSHVVLDEPLEKYKDSLLYYMRNKALFTPELQLLKIKELVLLLFQISNSTSFDHFISSLFYPSEYAFTKVIDTHCVSALSISQLATLCGMSLATFKRKFKEVYNDSPSHYMRVRKLEKATKLLSSSSMRINEVAFDCGFDSIRSFNRTFKEHFGVSPSSYRMHKHN